MINKIQILIVSILFIIGLSVTVSANTVTPLTDFLTCNVPTGNVWVHGNVSDGNGGVYRAAVTLTTSNGVICETVYTNQSGNYSFAGVFTQTYTVVASHPKYQATSPVFIAGVNEEYIVNFTLSEL